MSKHETLATLRQLKEFAEEAAALAKGKSREDLAADLGLRRHAERVIELIGEACNRLPEEVLANHPEIHRRSIRHPPAPEYSRIAALHACPFLHNLNQN